MLSRRCDLIGVWVMHDNWISIDLGCLDPRLAISFTLILGPVIVVTIVVLAISLNVMFRAAGPAIGTSSLPRSSSICSSSTRLIVATCELMDS